MKKLPASVSMHLKAATRPVARPAPNQQQLEDALRRAKEHREKGELRQAEQLCMAVLSRDPNNAQGLYLAGTLALDIDDPQLAVPFFKKAADKQPKAPNAHVALAKTYEKLHDYDEAINHFRRALTLKPNLVDALCGLGRCYTRKGKADLALPLYEKALRLMPDDGAARMGLANALTGLGRMEEAAAQLNECIRLREHVGAAYRMLSDTRKFSSEPAELGAILAELEVPDLFPSEAASLHHAAGKILNDIGHYEDAIDHFQSSKTVTGNDFDVESYRRWVDAMIGLFTPEMLATRAEFGDPTEIPVFVVGMPRSGTTLIEQVCSSHPAVHGAGELTKLGSIGRLAGFKKSQPGQISAMSKAVSQAMAADYLGYVRKLAPASALRIVDKMPHNFEAIGLIALLFPGARIIHSRRDAIDNCLSCFFTRFNDSHGYNTDLVKLGLYYRQYDRLMRHWNAILPGRIYECRYEDMVADQEAESRRLIDYLGLPWDDACLRFYEQDRTVSTPSRWQVRQPIYTSSVKRWRKYGAKIQPLIDALGGLAET
jgi:tetratricopeptide (TPR) repeat protein